MISFAIRKPLTVKYRRAINLTAHRVGFYDTNGRIAISKIGKPSRRIKRLQHLTPDTMVILENNADVVAYDIPHGNAVLISNVGEGRYSKHVSRLTHMDDNASVVFDPRGYPASSADVYYI